MTEDFIEQAITDHCTRNTRLRQLLIEKRVSLREERSLEVHFWSNEHTDAALLARELYRRGYLVTVIALSPGDDDAQRWSVEAGIKIAPEQALSEEFTKNLVRLAAAHDSTYDGWGTAV